MKYICMLAQDRGFGFIRVGEEEIYFRLTDVTAGAPLLGAFVEYSLVHGERGPRAESVEVVPGTAEQRHAWAHSDSRVKSEQLRRARSALRDALVRLEQQSSWNGRSHPGTRDAGDALSRLPLASPELVELCIERGLEQQRDFAHFETLVRQHSRTSPEVRADQERLVQKWPHLAKKLERTVARPRRTDLSSSVRASGIDHRVHTLAPCAQWLVCMDETGASTVRGESGTECRFVAVVIPEPGPLPPLPASTHFAELESADRDRILQQLLDAPVGVFGIMRDDLPETPGDRWVDGVMEVIGWVLRLLPIEEKGTSVQFLVEQRGTHRAHAEWDANLRTVQSYLAHSDRRMKNLDTRIAVVEKDADPFLAYADAVAHTWGCGSLGAKLRCRQSGLDGTCLHRRRRAILMHAWDALSRRNHLTCEEWRQLIDDSGRDPLGIAGLVLDRLAAECRSDRRLWERYFREAESHLESKATDLVRLGKELAWLHACKPSNVEFSPPLQLAWLTAELAHRNHLGHVDDALDARLTGLCDALHAEKPLLVCLAELHRAVLATNRFEFDAASRALERWKDGPMEIAGKQHWARVKSSFGQHAAFRGDLRQALRLFDEALECFRGLSEPELAALEIAQTSTFRAMATMDQPDADLGAVRSAVGAVVSLEPDRIRALARSTSPAEKYAHHLLVRYLVQRGSAEERAAYLEERDAWGSAEGHPWPLIQGYRGILLRPIDAENALVYLRRGFDLAEDPQQGPVVHLIGCVLGAVAMGWGHEPLLAAEDLERLRDRLPGAGPKLDRVRAALESPPDWPESLLAEVLPFNFR